MTIQIDGTDAMAIAQAAAALGIVLTVLIVGLLIYLMVRPPRNRARPGPAELDSDARELWRTVDLMESRIELLERAIEDVAGNQAPRLAPTEQAFEPDGEIRESRRIK